MCSADVKMAPKITCYPQNSYIFLEICLCTHECKFMIPWKVVTQSLVRKYNMVAEIFKNFSKFIYPQIFNISFRICLHIKNENDLFDTAASSIQFKI